MSADTSPLVLGVRSLARLAAVPRSRVRSAMDSGALVTLATDALRGRTCRYVVVNGEGAGPLDRWAGRVCGHVDLDDVDPPRTNGGRRWFYAGDVERAAEAGAFELHCQRVVTVGPFLRWAASLMPEGERAAILGAVVEEAPA